MRVGYARVSTRDQDPQLQIDALREAGVDKILEEKASGKSAKRPVLEATLGMLNEGDELVVWKIDRLGRSVLDLETILSDLRERGVSFRSLTQPELSTTGPTGKLVQTILSAVAEYERALIQERVRNGVAAAKRQGKHTGRPFAMDPNDEAELLELWEDGWSVAKLAKRWKVHEATIYRAKTRALARREDSNGKR